MKRFVLLQSFAAVALAGIGPVTDFYVGNKILAPDGFNRSTVLAGSSPSDLGFPGPLITGKKGDHFQINLINQLTDTSMLRSTSVHWHGLFQAGSSWADGPVGVTQCPIAPDNSFLYDFHVPDQAGTFWYHSHYSTQYCDGLRGAFVIRDDNDPHASLYDVDDDDTVIVLADWYHASAKDLSGTFPAELSTLINGLGRYSQGPATPLAVVNVEKGKKYRLRLVSISCDPFYTFSIDGHDLTIIEADGVNTDPLTVDSLEIYAGQRYSVVLNANQDKGNYWIRANASNGPQGFVGGTNSAILRYAGADNSDPTTEIGPLSNRLDESNLHALGSTSVPGNHTLGEADVNLFLDIDFIPPNTLTVNGAKFVPPTAPVLLQILSGTKTAQDLLPPGSVYVLPRNAVIEVTIPGGSGGAPHPFHLHGHTFDVVQSAGSDTLNWNNPVKRDVVNTGKLTTDNTTIRFTTDNPGPWIFHCHIDWHLEVGLAIVFAEDPDTIQNSTHPAAWDQLCPIYDNLPPDEL